MNKLIFILFKSVTVDRLLLQDGKDYRFDEEFVPLLVLLAVELDGSVGNCFRAVGIVRCLARKD